MGELQVKPDVSKFPILPYLLIYTFPILFGIALIYKGWLSAIGIYTIFMALPLGDFIFERDHVNPTKEEAKILDGMIIFRVITWLWVPMQLFLVFGSIHFTYDESVPVWSRFLFAVSAGLMAGGAGFDVGHELMHKRNKFEKFLGHIIYLSLGYDHFAIEHNLGHHYKVATPRDPATALLGENFWFFLPRTFLGGIKSSWKIEKKILAQKGKGVFNPSNRVVRGYLIEAGILAVCTYFYGLHGALMYTVQCAIAIILLEAVNYIEHYGLMREQYADGSYEPVDPLHSWNAAESLTNYLLFKLQRHSDHHTYPYKRYQTLISHGHSAQMPTGYPGMILLSLVPPLWFKVMDPLVHELRARLQAQKKADALLSKSIKGN